MKLSVAIALAGLLSTPVIAQTTSGDPHFRLNWNGGINSVPGGDTGAPGGDPEPPVQPNPNVTLSYAPAIATLGQPQPVVASPHYTNGFTPYGFEFTNYVPDASIDNETGVITWTPVGTSGTNRAIVRMFTDASQSISASVTGVFEIDVDGPFSISVDPGNMEFQKGQPGISQTFTATSSTTDLPAGGYWSVETSADYSPIYNEENIVTIDLDEINANTGGFYPGHQWFQFTYNWWDTSWNSLSVRSDPVELTVQPAPTIGYTSSSDSTYRVDDEYIIQIRPGTAVTIPGIMRNGAIGYEASPPSWIENFGTLPPGITIAANGTISGTTTAQPGELFDVSRVAKAANGALGSVDLIFMVVNSFTNPSEDKDDDGYLAYEDPDDNDPKVPFDADAIPHSLQIHEPWARCDVTNTYGTPYGLKSMHSGFGYLSEVEEYVNTLNDGSGYDLVGTDTYCVYNEQTGMLAAQWGGSSDADGFPPGWNGQPKTVFLQFCRVGGSDDDGPFVCEEWGGWTDYQPWQLVLYPGDVCNLNGNDALYYEGVLDSPAETGTSGPFGYFKIDLYPDDVMPTLQPEGTMTFPREECGLRFYTPPAP